MEPLQMAAIGQYLRNDAALSALPDAPVVPDDAARLTRTRHTMATVLRRVADVVAPEPAPVRPRPA